MRRLRDGTCPQGRSSGTIHDTSAHEHGQNLMRVATIKVHEKPVEGRREKERRGEPKRDRAKRFYFAMPRCLVSRKKNYGPRERWQIVEIIRCDSSLVLLLASASDLVSRRPLPRSVLAGKLCARPCEIPLIRDAAASHA